MRRAITVAVCFGVWLEPSFALAATSTSPDGIAADRAIVDKETGRIFWESSGGRSTLTANLADRLHQYGVVHARAVALSVLFYVVVGRWLLGQFLVEGKATNPVTQPSPSLRVIRLMFSLVLWIPSLPTWVVAMAIIVYLVEAYFCDTHQFLSHRRDASSVESLLEQLRTTDPVVSWKVRTFQYEPWPLVTWLFQRVAWAQQRLRRPTNDDDDDATTTAAIAPPYTESLPPLLLRKRITHQVTSNFTLASGSRWVDQTTAGVWTRRRTTTTTAPPLAQIWLTTAVVLGDARARDAYLQQQAALVREAGQDQNHDYGSEFATQVQVPGCPTRLLVQRRPSSKTPLSTVQRLRQAFHMVLVSPKVFWICTLVGAGAFYRLWMARQANVLYVRLVKEAVVVGNTAGLTKAPSWWPRLPLSSQLPSNTPDSTKTTNSSHFTNLMLQLDVYSPHSVTPATLPQETSTQNETHVAVTNATTTSTQVNVTATKVDVVPEKELNETTAMESSQSKLGEPTGTINDATKLGNTTLPVSIGKDSDESLGDHATTEYPINNNNNIDETEMPTVSVGNSTNATRAEVDKELENS